MPRPKLIRQDSLPYHVFSRSNNKERFYLPLDRIWDIMCGLLDQVSFDYHAHIHSFVLMSNHFHMLISTPSKNLDKIMQYFIRESAKRIGEESNRINRIFGGRYQRSLLRSEEYFLNALKYVYQNPVEAGICRNVEEYPFSTIQWVTESGRYRFPISMEPEFLFRLLPKEREPLLKWLNTPFLGKQREVIRLGLRKSECRWPRGNDFKAASKSLRLPEM